MFFSNFRPEEQICISGRDIVDNIMSIRYVIDTEYDDFTQGIIIKIDQEKIFCRVFYEYMFTVLKSFNFGDNFYQLDQNILHT